MIVTTILPAVVRCVVQSSIEIFPFESVAEQAVVMFFSV